MPDRPAAAKPKKRPFYGGQAVIEGVMMRGASQFAVACRRQSGEIELQEEPVPAFFTRFRWAKWPLLRGVFALADALTLGMKALAYSSNLALDDERQASAAASPVSQLLSAPVGLFLGVHTDAPPARRTAGQVVSTISITASMVSGLAIGLGLFLILPNLIAFSPWVSAVVPGDLARNLLEGVLRVLIVLGYIGGIGLLAPIRRVFQYHGAEHKSINALEANGGLDLDAATRASRIHPRCGTNFILTVLMIKIVVFALLPVGNSHLLRIAYRLLLLPAVAAIAYEIIRLAGTYRRFAPLQWLVLPGLLTQRLTTREPDRGMLEVAMAALRSVLVREGDERAGVDDEAAAVIA